LISLLLRRGADPSHSDWPLPVLALAVRAGDKQMVELLLNKKAEVNCQLNSIRHASLTPLHIACGCLSPHTIDITRLLLEHGANVNAESLPGNKEYFSLIDPLITDLTKMVNRFSFSFVEK
jgi:ankyrin repeat protein